MEASKRRMAHFVTRWLQVDSEMFCKPLHATSPKPSLTARKYQVTLGLLEIFPELRSKYASLIYHYF